jgi:cytochrome P450
MLFGMGLLSTLGKSTVVQACIHSDTWIGDHHKAQRKMMNPVFSVDNLRLMLPIFLDVAYNVC